MTKKLIRILTALPLLLALAACASIQIPGIGGAAQQPAAQGSPGAIDPANQPIEAQLAMGTLALEGTELQVTPEQAKTLLTLWKAVKSLGGGEAISQGELDALYAQIEETMSADQVQAIEGMELTPEEARAIMDRFGIDAGPVGDNPGQLSEAEIATRVAGGSGQQREEGGFVIRRGPGGGVPPEGFIPPEGGEFQRQRTPKPGMVNAPRRVMNLMFVDPLIAVLEERAGE